MSLDKAIKSGKEHRKSWENSNKYFSKRCRNHGGCDFCEGNRLHKFEKQKPAPDITDEDYLRNNDAKRRGRTFMKNYRVAVDYSMFGTITVEAESVEEAIKWAKENIDELKLPDDAEYMDGSYQISDDVQMTKYINGEEE